LPRKVRCASRHLQASPSKNGGVPGCLGAPMERAKVRRASRHLQASPSKNGGVPGSLGAPMARCQGQVRLQYPQASPSRGGVGARPIGNVLGIWQHPSPPQNWYKNGGSLLWSSVHQFSSKALVKRMDSSLSIFSPPLFPCLFSFFPCLFDLFCFASVSSSISFFFSVFIFFFLLIMLILNSNFQFYK
jgi:hypothetical protein